MPKRTDISSILIIGAGPIIIGQACEFDYSGTQAVKALKEEGYRIILVNSNPATIMTDPEFADATYVEPITPEIVAKIIEKERPDAVLPTMGGQTALNTALALFNDGTLEKFGVKMIGADAEAIDKAEDRLKFRDAMAETVAHGLHQQQLAAEKRQQQVLEVVRVDVFAELVGREGRLPLHLHQRHLAQPEAVRHPVAPRRVVVAGARRGRPERIQLQGCSSPGCPQRRQAAASKQ